MVTPTTLPSVGAVLLRRWAVIREAATEMLARGAR